MDIVFVLWIYEWGMARGFKLQRMHCTQFYLK